MHFTATSSTRRRSVWRTAPARVPDVVREAGHEIRILSDGLKGRPSVVEVRAQRGAGIPDQVPAHEQRRLLVLEGRVAVTVGKVDVELGPYDEVPCAGSDPVRVESDDARFLVTAVAAA